MWIRNCTGNLATNAANYFPANGNSANNELITIDYENYF